MGGIEIFEQAAGEWDWGVETVKRWSGPETEIQQWSFGAKVSRTVGKDI